MSDKKYIRQKINNHIALADAVDEVVECAEPIYSGNDTEPIEYVVDGEAYKQMFDCLVSLKKTGSV